MRKLLLFSCVILTSCGADGKYQDYLRMRDIPPPTETHFIHCFNYGCQSRMALSLPQSTNKRLTNNFKPLAENAEQERKQIAKAVQIFETDIGAIAGTENDKFGTFDVYKQKTDKPLTNQQDCVDESTNTTTYLGLLEKMGYLKFHKPIFPTARQPFASGSLWWHQTAVIKDLETGEKFAVDSWFEDNGHPAHIVPVKEWKKGWSPRKAKDKDSAKNE